MSRGDLVGWVRGRSPPGPTGTRHRVLEDGCPSDRVGDGLQPIEHKKERFDQDQSEGRPSVTTLKTKTDSNEERGNHLRSSVIRLLTTKE